jgi:LacI family transcriptional regulator
MATEQNPRKPAANTPSRQSRPDLLVLLDPQLGLCRQIARGVWAYAAEDPQWWVRVGTVPSPNTLRRLVPDDLAGVIGFFGSGDLEDAAIETYLHAPVVNVSARPRESRLLRVLADNVQVGRLAGEHLLNQGFRHFAFAPISGHGYSIQREDGFREVIEEAGHEVLPGASSIRELPDWLGSLPRPVGVLVATDARAVQVLQACREVGLAVPEDVAIVGVDNDEYLCESSPIGISSVDPAGRRIGYHAAKLVAEIDAGGSSPGKPILTPPGRVVVRPSSDTTAIEDTDVAFAVRFIRDHACEKLRVDEILDHLDISRRTLEKRFRKHIGRTLHEEIRRVQMDTACMLLSETDLQIPEVAARAGFSDRKRFTTTFSDLFGLPPIRYRRQNRRR